MVFTARDDWKAGDEYPAARMIELEAAVAAKAEKGDKGDKGDTGAPGPTQFTAAEVTALKELIAGKMTPPGDHVAALIADAPFHIAHRAGGANWPEFSEQGIVGSISRGYRAIELSVRVCGTGEYVCVHDWNAASMVTPEVPIWSTPWAELAPLETKVPTENPAPGVTPGRFLRLTDALALIPDDVVVFIDHKVTSDTSTPKPEDVVDRERLLDLLDSYDNAQNRFVWKVFAPAWASADYARTRGYRSWGIHYGDEATTAAEHFDSFDLLGLEWRDTPEQWAAITAAGKPVIGHIIKNRGQYDQAATRGATGFMVSNVLALP